MIYEMKKLSREILLAFWKAHILHHASEGPVVGNWIIKELWRHGYEVSPGTLYPLLQRMEANGWLRCEVDSKGGLRARRRYYATKKGAMVLETVRKQIEQLYDEVCAGSSGQSSSAKGK